jgi:hypothetical protein
MASFVGTTFMTIATLAVRVANATNAAFEQIELDPGIGSPSLGRRLGVAGLRTWWVTEGGI